MAAGAGVGIIDVEDELRGLRTMVTDLIDRVSHLNQDVAGLMAPRDGSICGEAYADDAGPAVRAKFFEVCARSNEDHGQRITEVKDLVTDPEAIMATLTSIQTGMR